MEKLKLEHLAPYLPYGLKIQTLNRRENLLTYKIVIGMSENSVTYEFFKGGACDRLPFKDIKPILRPLSDLTKEIEHKGEKLVPLNEIKNLELYSHYKLEDFVRNNFSYGSIYSLSYQLLNQILEWHFDVFGLIDKGLAIDINTI